MQIICRGSKLWQLSACNVIALLKYINFKCLLQAENNMTYRWSIHGRSADTSLVAEICKEMSELFEKQVNAQRKTSGVHASSSKPTKMCNGNER